MAELPKGKTTLFNYLADGSEDISGRLDRVFAQVEEERSDKFFGRPPYENVRKAMEDANLFVPLLEELGRQEVPESKAVRMAIDLEEHVERKVFKALKQCPENLGLKTHYLNAERCGFPKQKGPEEQYSSVHVPATYKPFEELLKQ